MDVFTDRRFGGNPLAIFPDARGLSSETMQQIASEMNLSETVFIVRRDESPIPLLRIFTPKVELPFAGHPTVGAALFLAEQAGADGSTAITMETKAGLLKARIVMAQGQRHARITAPEAPYGGPAPSAESCCAFLSLPDDALAFEPVAYSAGVPYTIVPLKSRALLANASPDLAVWHAQLKGCWAPAIYAVTMDDWEAGQVVHARMFGPGVGVLEDPATGSAAVAVAGWLAERQRLEEGERDWLIHQGDDMGRPSRMTITAVRASGATVSAHVSGTAVRVISGSMTLTPPSAT
jgi:trans-2,3-dihydro-3-hydroxyanthranilate isomerase